MRGCVTAMVRGAHARGTLGPDRLRPLGSIASLPENAWEKIVD